jgi:hypothetical protein
MGLAEREGLQQRITFQMGTLSKAAGLSGGYVAASREWIDLLVNRARSFIYSTAPPPALAHAASGSASPPPIRRRHSLHWPVAGASCSSPSKERLAPWQMRLAPRIHPPQQPCIHSPQTLAKDP